MPRPQRPTKPPAGRAPCSLCGGRKPELEYVGIIGGDGKTYVLCEPHATVYCETLSHIPLEEIVRRKAKSEAQLAKDMAAAKATEESGEPSFIPQQVNQSMGKIVKVKRKAIIMNGREFKEHLQRDPLVKWTKGLRTMFIRDDDGNLEQVWLFKWQPTALRTISVGEFVQVETVGQLLASGSHKYPQQADEAFQSYYRRLKEQQQLGNMEPALPSLSSVFEGMKLAMPEGLVFGVGNPSLPMAAFASSKASGDSGGNMAESATGATEAWAAASLPPEAASASPQASGKRPSPPTMSAAAPRKRIAVGPMAAASPSAESPAASPSQAGSGDNLDSISQAGTAISARGMLPNPAEEVQKWTSKLDLVGAMLKPMGVQKHHAENAMSKLRGKGHHDDARQLREHIKLLSLAELLHSDKIFSTDETEYMAAVHSLEKKVGFPAEVQKNMVCRAIERHGKMINDLASFEKVLHMAWPWLSAPTGSQGAVAATFDPKNPRCSALSCGMDEKVGVFTNQFWKGPMTRMLAGAAETTDLCRSALQEVLVHAEAVVDEGGDMQDAEAELSMELLSSCRSVLSLLQPQGLVRDPELTERLSEIKSLEDSQHSEATAIMQVTYLAIEDVEPFAKNLTLINKKMATLRELCPTIAEHTETMHKVDLSDFTGACSSMQSLLHDSPRILHGLGDDLKSEYEQQVLEVLEKIATNVIDRGDATKEELGECSKLLVESSSQFPLQANLFQWTSDVGTRLAQTIHQSTLSAFLDLISPISSDQELMKEADNLLAAIAQVEGVPLTDTACEKASAMLTLLHQTALTNIEQPGLATLLSFGEKLLSTVPKAKHPAVAASLPQIRAAHNLQTMHLDLKGRLLHGDSGKINQEGLDKPGVRDEVRTLQQMSVEVASIVDKARQENTELVRLETVQSLAANLIKQVTAFDLQLMQESGEAVAQTLRPIAGGVSGGGTWHAAIPQKKKNSWAEVLKVANATICKEKSVATMKASIDKLEQAIRAAGTAKQMTPKPRTERDRCDCFVFLAFGFRAFLSINKWRLFFVLGPSTHSPTLASMF